jgi:hypothetical protein
MRLPPSSANDQPHNPELARRMHELHRKALFENLPYTMGFGVVAALGVMWVLWGNTNHMILLCWVAARILVAGLRLAHGSWTWRKHNPSQEHPYTSYRVLAFLDAVAWSALGWGLTPVQQLDVAVVSISILLAIAALGVFMLYVDYLTAALFISPILLPNALYTLTREDRLGVFACLAILGFWATLLREARRSSSCCGCACKASRRWPPRPKPCARPKPTLKPRADSWPPWATRCAPPCTASWAWCG